MSPNTHPSRSTSPLRYTRPHTRFTAKPEEPKDDGDTVAVKSIVEPNRRIARGYLKPENYRMRAVARGLLLLPDLR